MKKLIILLMICCMFTACGSQNDTVTDAPEQTENAEGVVISPLPTTLDMNALDNCTLAVSFEKGDAYVDDTGAMQLDVTVYTYDLYDMVDIANLKVGDTIVIQGKDVMVESLETLESGLLFINGGMDNGGYDLWHNDSGVYFEHGYNDAKSYYSIGEATFRVSADFEFVDSVFKSFRDSRKKIKSISGTIPETPVTLTLLKPGFSKIPTLLLRHHLFMPFFPPKVFF